MNDATRRPSHALIVNGELIGIRIRNWNPDSVEGVGSICPSICWAVLATISPLITSSME